jgi:hypothetical protein
MSSLDLVNRSSRTSWAEETDFLCDLCRYTFRAGVLCGDFSRICSLHILDVELQKVLFCSSGFWNRTSGKNVMTTGLRGDRGQAPVLIWCMVMCAITLPGGLLSERLIEY